MPRDLRIFWLVLFAAFAMSTVVTSAASAESSFNFHVETISTTVTGKEHRGFMKITTHGGTVECSVGAYTGGLNAGSSSELTLTPTYSGCKAFGFINVPIDTNGCGYLFTSGTKTGPDFEGSAHIECPGGGVALQVTAPGCELTIEAQTPTINKVTYTNIGSGATRELTVDVDLTKVHYTEHEKSGAPNCESETTTTTNGTIITSILITAENPTTKAHHGLWVE